MLHKLKSLIPVAWKQPVRDYIDRRAWETQPRLTFNADNLLPRDAIDVGKIMNDPAVREMYAQDHAELSRLFTSGEIGGGVNPGDRQAIYHIISALHPRQVLEIGTHVGASTSTIALAQRHYDGKLTTVDITDVNAADGHWAGLGMPRPPKETLNLLGAGSAVTFIHGPAAQALRNRHYDLVFLDGDHSALAVYQEISAALDILTPEGTILLHDFYPGRRPLTPDGNVIDGPATAAERINRETSSIVFLPLGEMPWPTKSGGNATSLAMVLRPAAGDQV